MGFKNVDLLGTAEPLIAIEAWCHVSMGDLCWGGGNTRSRQGEEIVQYYSSSRANNGTQSRVINKARLPTSSPSASQYEATSFMIYSSLIGKSLNSSSKEQMQTTPIKSTCHSQSEADTSTKILPPMKANQNNLL